MMIPNKINQHQNDIRRIIQSFAAAGFCPNYLESHLDELISAMQTSVKEEPSIEVSKKVLEAARKLAQVCPDKWKVIWLIALAAARLGVVELVDKACQIVLSLNKEFWFARELPKHVRGYYSQLGQDELIERFFSERKPRCKTFIEVGAFDGRHYSNVRRLVEKYGWQGVSVEPVGKNYAKLCQSYQGYNVTCIQAAVSNHSGTADMSVSTYPHLPEWGSDVASLTTEDNDRWTRKYGAQWCKETVVVKTLTEIISESNLKYVDLLSIDAEGHDFEVLEGLDFSRYKPQLIVVEYGNERQKIISLLSTHGYSVIYDNKQDLFFADIQTIVDDYATRNYTGQTAEPYVEIQRDVEENINVYLKKDIRDTLRMVIVGAYLGDEIGRFLNRYPNLEIHAFEANPNTFQKLRLKFQNNPNVHCYNYAVSDQNGILEFYENNLAGTGSILPIEPSGQADRTIDVAKQYGMVNKEKFAVQSIRLDDFEPLKNKTIDLLWCDVQGAELHVLKGAAKTLRSCSSLLLEVWSYAMLYKGQARLIDLERYLSRCGFYLAGIGLDHKIGNGSGNSFWLSQRRMSRRVINEAFCDIKDVRSRINPHLFKINYLPAQGTVKLQTVNPVFLLNSRRLDVCAKVIYGRFCQFSLQSPWGEEVYLAHLKKINNYHEEDGFDKQGAESFILAYKNILASMAENGFDSRQSLIPVGNDGTIIDGSHRLAAAYICKKDVCTAVFDRSTNSYDYEYFLKRGLSRKYSDAMAYEYCRIKKNTYIVSVFPSAEGRDSEVVDIIQKYATIVYRKEILLEKNGPLLLIKQMYQGEPWLGTWANLFKGAKYKADQCFRKTGCVRVFLVETEDLDNLKQCKSEIRHLFGIENHSVHINDSYEETLRLAQIYFNENSIHFLNHARLNYFENFYRLLQDYVRFLDEHHVDKDCFCVDGSAVMAVYGIREARDIDYFHHGYDDIRYPNEELIGSHNQEIKYHTKTMDDIIFNPENHFYFEGIKFASLAVVSAMKSRRGEKKDLVDVNLMAPYLNHPVVDAMANTEPSALKTKIVGLVAARNEKNLIGQCLRLLSQFTDAIVYLDDCSTDDSVKIVQSLAGQCRVERILTKQQWWRDEPGDRNKMLQAGREIGGTHFIVLDADEAFTSNLLNHNTLRERILSLKPGDQLLLNWICLWRSVERYRFDKSVWTNNYKPFVFCDDGRCSYASEFIHTPRVPQNLAGRKIKIEGYEYGVLHFQFVNWSNLLLKQAWYRCIERIREPQKSIAEINKRYAPSKDETNIHLESSNPEWFRYYSSFDSAVFGLPDHWRGEQIRGWFKEYGVEYFKGLDIWDIITSQGEVRHSVTDSAAINPPVLGSSSYLVSAIVSTYNSEAFIRGCLQDLVEQTLYQKGQLEIIVVNSGSQENEDAIVKEFQSRYPHIQYIKTAERETIYAAWNRGIRAARGRYITNANTDDRHCPQMLEKMSAVLESCPNIAYVYSQFYVTSIPHQTWQTKTPACVSTWVPEYSRETLLDRYYCGPQPMWRRSLHDEYGYFDERFKVCGDYEFVLRISQTHDLMRLAEPLGLYYKNPDSLERTAGTHDAECNFIRTLYRQFKNYTIRKPLMHPLPKFGVIIRNYNKGRYINAAIQSILAQTVQDWELIIVDDASTDDSVNTVQKYLQDTRIRLIRHNQNRGVSHAALSGIAGLSADLFGELDSDDVLTPDALEQVIKAHSDHPECGFIYTQHRVCDQDLNPTKLGFCRELPQGCTALQNDVISAFRTYKMRDYIQTSMHDSELDIAEDKDIFYKLEEVTKFHFVPQALYLVRQLPQSQSRGADKLLKGLLSHARAKVNAYRRRCYQAAREQGLDPKAYFEQILLNVVKQDIHVSLFFSIVFQYKELLAEQLLSIPTYPAESVWQLVVRIGSESSIRKFFNVLEIHKILTDPIWLDKYIELRKRALKLTKPDGCTEMICKARQDLAENQALSDSLVEALQLFLKAQQAFAAGNMLTARRLMAHYQAAMNYDHLPRIDRRDPSTTPLMSVIIVTYQRSADVAKLLDCFQQQTDSDFETIVVDNGGTDIAAIADKADCIIPCPINFNLSEGRNIGAWFARGRIAVFVDDDALVKADYLASVRQAFTTYQVLGLRGRTLPKTPVPNQHISICDRGDKPFPTLCNQEGNSAFLLWAWRAVGGQDPLLFGHEGTDLTWRLIHAFGRRDVVIYWPDTVIYHDYGDGGKARRKRRQQDINQDYLLYKYDQSISDVRLQLETLHLTEGNALSMQPQAVADAYRWHGLCYQDNLHKLDTVPSPKVAVVIACQNMAEYLPQCLDGICAQTLKEWEALIVDDGSTDGSREILQRYAERDKRFRLFFFDTSEGPYVRRNFAIQHARAPFISIQDADDILAPQKLEMLLEEILRDDSLGVVGSFFGRFIDSFRGPEYCDRIRLQVSHDEIVKGYHRSFYVCWHASAIIRKTLFEQVGLYDCQPWGSDTFWLAKAALYGILTGKVRFKNLPEMLTYKREHKKSQTGTILLNHPNGRRKVLSRYGQQKLMEIAQKARENSGFDVGQAIRSCNCNDFIPRFGHLFEQWESGAVTRQMIADLLSKAMHEFCSGYCSDCLISLNSLCDVCNGVEKEIQGLNLLRGLCQFIAGEDESSRWSLEQEYADHGTVQAADFIKRYLTQTDNRPGGIQRREIVDHFVFMDTPRSVVEAEVIYDNRTPVAPQVSVILDCRRGTVDLEAVLAEWRAQTQQNFELLILTTGNSKADFADQTLPLPTAVLNFAEGISSAAVKNKAAAVARGDILVFAAWHIAVRPDCVSVVQEALKTPAIGAVSGRIILPSGSWNTNLDYGEKKMFCCLDQDLLCAVKRDVFTRAGGLDEGLWGRDMLSLSWTIYSGLDTEWGSILYVPDLAGTWRPDVPVTTNYMLRQLAADQLFWRRSCPEKYWDFVVFAERCFWVNEVSGQGDPVQAGQVVQFFAGRHRAVALQWARLAYRLRSDRLAELYALANCEWDAGNRDEAAQHYQQVLAIPLMQKIETEVFGPEERSKVSEILRCYVMTSLKLAEYHRDQGHCKTARQMLERLKANPNAVLDSQQQAQFDVLYSEVRTRKNTSVPAETACRNQRPRVSVIMPAYNSAAYIDSAIQSVLAQTYRDFELIIVNDGSTDRTEQVIRNYHDSRIRCFSQANAGLAATRNTALRHAIGELIVPLDDDDRMTPEFIAQHVAAFERHPEADLIYCDDHLVNEAGRSLRVIRRKEVHDQTQLISGLFQGGFPFIPFRTCIRRSVFDKIGLYDETLRVAEDYDMMRRFAAHGLIARHLAGDFYIRCVRTDSLSRNHTRKKAEMHFGVIRRFIDTFTWEQLFPDASWEGLDSVHRAFQGHYLSAHVFQAIERNYIQNRTPGFYAEVAIDFAIEQLEHCLELSPDNPEILQKIEECRRRKPQEMAAVEG